MLWAGCILLAMGSVRVAVIVPVFNRPRAVLEALDSIAAQTLSPAKLIIVDDGSTDDTAGQVEGWLASHRLTFEARLIRQSNCGPSAARNRGVDYAARCELLAFLDSDDLWPADYLTRMVQALASSPSAVAASSDLRQTDQRSGRSTVLGMGRLCGRATARIFLDGPSPPSSTVVRAAAFDRIGGFEQQYRVFEDFYLCLRLSMLGCWLYVPGEPVQRRSYLGTTLGGQRQLTETFGCPSFYAGQLRMLQRFIHADGGAAVLPRRVRQSGLARCWYRLGRSFARDGRTAEAVKCFKAASRRNPWLLRAYRRRATSTLRRLFG